MDSEGKAEWPSYSTTTTAVLPQLSIDIVKRSDQAKGFTVLRRRWVVERALCWFCRCRPLAKDFEKSDPKRAGISPFGLDPTHAATALRSRINFPDVLLEYVGKACSGHGEMSKWYPI